MHEAKEGDRSEWRVPSARMRGSATIEEKGKAGTYALRDVLGKDRIEAFEVKSQVDAFPQDFADFPPAVPLKLESASRREEGEKTATHLLGPTAPFHSSLCPSLSPSRLSPCFAPFPPAISAAASRSLTSAASRSC